MSNKNKNKKSSCVWKGDLMTIRHDVLTFKISNFINTTLLVIKWFAIELNYFYLVQTNNIVRISIYDFCASLSGLKTVLGHTEKSCLALDFPRILKSNRKIYTSFVSPGLQFLEYNKTGFNLTIFHFNIRKKLSIIIYKNKYLLLLKVNKFWLLQLSII